jgi:hypothetical protein
VPARSDAAWAPAGRARAAARQKARAAPRAAEPGFFDRFMILI